MAYKEMTVLFYLIKMFLNKDQQFVVNMLILLGFSTTPCKRNQMRKQAILLARSGISISISVITIVTTTTRFLFDFFMSPLMLILIAALILIYYISHISLPPRTRDPKH
jgi:hypothetical protein